MNALENQWYLQPTRDHIAVVNDGMKTHASVLELNASRRRKDSILFFQPELFVRSTKTSLDDVLADLGTTMKAIVTHFPLLQYTIYQC